MNCMDSSIYKFTITLASRRLYFLKSVILHIRKSIPFLMEMTAFLEKTMVCGQFHRHFTSSLFANYFFLKKIQTQSVSTENAFVRNICSSNVGEIETCPRFLGTVNLANMIPAIQALMITPTMLWIDKRIATLGHSSFGNLLKSIFLNILNS